MTKFQINDIVYSKGVYSGSHKDNHFVEIGRIDAIIISGSGKVVYTVGGNNFHESSLELYAAPAYPDIKQYLGFV